MRHKKDIKKLGRNKGHRKALMRNLAISLFTHEKIITTEAKAKQLRRVVERLITLGKKGDLSSIRRINSFLNNRDITRKVREIAERYNDREGGYTRIIKIGQRRGDGAKSVIITLI
ncbi:MAG TPA: 50S ribosomal protein L17 [Firmicutes bacterium]|nr:MAG: 50S ribosomal protein L17 [Candidatus Omnitrophota bacterium]HDD64941.1 50S ribosomal protein L17 [Bacillota bacterium]